MAESATGDRGPKFQPESFGRLLSQLAHSSAALVRDEIDLAKQQIREKIRSVGAGLSVIAVGTAIGLIAIMCLVAALIIALSHYMPLGLSALLVGVILLLMGSMTAFWGLRRLKAKNSKPQRIIGTLEEDKEWLKETS